jgi:hypothetical protein
MKGVLFYAEDIMRKESKEWRQEWWLGKIAASFEFVVWRGSYKRNCLIV